MRHGSFHLFLMLGGLMMLSAAANAENIVAWDFTKGQQGWTPNASIANAKITSEGFDFDAVAGDPFISGPAVSYPSGQSIVVTIRMRLNVQGVGELFHGPFFQAGRSVRFPINPDNQWHEYTVSLPALGAGARLRLDPGDLTGHVTVAWIRADGVSNAIEMDNGALHVKLDLATGGAISYLSLSGSARNLINIADRGRYVQQSYYAGRALDRKAEGQSPSWSPWPWNPIGAGDTYGNPARTLASDPARGVSLTSGTLYVKTRPLLWDMNNEEAQCDFETWVTLSGKSAHVRNRLTCFRTDSRWPALPNDQELPAVYTIADLPNLYTYEGSQPWTNAPLTRKVNQGPPWIYWKTPEHWAAQVDANNWGVAVYNKRCTQFVGGFYGQPGGGSTVGSTGYIAPLRTETLDKNTIYNYEYDLIVGTLTEIRQWVYRAEQAKATADAWSPLR